MMTSGRDASDGTAADNQQLQQQSAGDAQWLSNTRDDDRGYHVDNDDDGVGVSGGGWENRDSDDVNDWRSSSAADDDHLTTATTATISGVDLMDNNDSWAATSDYNDTTASDSYSY